MSNREGAPYGSLRVDVEQSRRMSEMTIAYYDRMAETYWDGTRDHDVSQNYTALLDAIETDPPYSMQTLGTLSLADFITIIAESGPANHKLRARRC